LSLKYALSGFFGFWTDYICLEWSEQGTGKLVLVDSSDLVKLVVGHWNITKNRREIIVRKAIDATFDGFIHNKGMSYEAYNTYYRTDRRIDHRLVIGDTILAIETDEFAHHTVDKNDEIIRYEKFKVFPHKFIFIRFNPDNNKERSNDQTSFQYKLSTLMHTITTQIHRIQKGCNVNKLEIYELFY